MIRAELNQDLSTASSTGRLFQSFRDDVCKNLSASRLTAGEPNLRNVYVMVYTDPGDQHIQNGSKPFRQDLTHINQRRLVKTGRTFSALCVGS